MRTDQIVAHPRTDAHRTLAEQAVRAPVHPVGGRHAGADGDLGRRAPVLRTARRVAAVDEGAEPVDEPVAPDHHLERTGFPQRLRDLGCP
ncbi:hypothetical protein ACWGJB_36300 [Streptomyces sp. NPDC054813]